jgi:alpha-tubulin suppressor-like RCC1 family protein
MVIWLVHARQVWYECDLTLVEKNEVLLCGDNTHGSVGHATEEKFVSFPSRIPLVVPSTHEVRVALGINHTIIYVTGTYCTGS